MQNKMDLPKPILLNCIKHHSGYIKKRIDSFGAGFTEMRNELQTIGASQMDLYFGRLSPKEICNEVVEQLKRSDLLDRPKYSNWLVSEGKDYQTITLSDTSAWTLRLAEDEERYIHIHPGRYAPNTVRVKAMQLKTAIVVLTYTKSNNGDPLSIETVNLVRKKILNESTIKSLNKSSGIVQIIKLLSTS